jgi:lipoprotein NlpI
MTMKKLLGIIILTLAFGFASQAQTTQVQTAQDWNKQGLEHFKKYEYKVAYECFSKAVEMKADYAEAFYNRGMTWFQLPAGTYSCNDGCTDLKKAKELGFKLKKDDLSKNGCE